MIVRYLGVPGHQQPKLTSADSWEMDNDDSDTLELEPLELLPGFSDNLDGDEGGFPDSPADEGIFNYQAAIETFLGNEPLVRSLLRPQMDKMRGEVEILRAAIAAADWETVRTTAHSIKGSCRNMDMKRCGEAAAVLEAAGKNSDDVSAASGLKVLEREYPLLRARVEWILSAGA